MERWPDGISLFVNAGPEDGFPVFDIWHNGGPGGPWLTAHTEEAARSICDAIEELHALRSEVVRLRSEAP